MTSEEDCIPRKKTRFKRVKKARRPIKQARDRATLRKKEQVFLADSSDEENKFTGK